jgi:hypothetical protein
VETVRLGYNARQNFACGWMRRYFELKISPKAADMGKPLGMSLCVFEEKVPGKRRSQGRKVISLRVSSYPNLEGAFRYGER